MNARSYLFVPGDRPDRFEKALRSGADVVVLDLEDAVAAGSKADTREAVASWLSMERPTAYVRVNAVRTGWLAEDLDAIAGRPGHVGVMLPEAGGVQQVAKVREPPRERRCARARRDCSRGVVGGHRGRGRGRRTFGLRLSRLWARRGHRRRR